MRNSSASGGIGQVHACPCCPWVGSRPWTVHRRPPDVALPMPSPTPPQRRTKERWTLQWKELYDEVVTTGLCTGCAGCVIACPHDVIGYDARRGRLQAVPARGRARPRRLQPRREGLHVLHPGLPPVPGLGARGRRAPLRPRARSPTRSSGIYKDILLDPGQRRHGPPRSARTAGSCRRSSSGRSSKDNIDAALVSLPRGRRHDAGRRSRRRHQPRRRSSPRPAAATRTRPTRWPTTRRSSGARALALVGMSCQSSVPPVMWHARPARSPSRSSFNIGLLCSKTFDDAIFEELFEAKYGLRKADIKKMNIKGVFQIWMQQRRLPRDPPQGVPRLDARGLQALPRLRRRARRHLHRRHRQVQRLDAHHRPHRPRPRDHAAA